MTDVPVACKQVKAHSHIRCAVLHVAVHCCAMRIAVSGDSGAVLSWVVHCVVMCCCVFPAEMYININTYIHM